MIIQIKSISTKKLTKKCIDDICRLKNQFWKYNLIIQKKFFIQNVKNNDIHNLMFLNSKLVGYTLLRKRTLKVGNIRNKYILFDTLIIDKKIRKKKLSIFLMVFNLIIINKKKLPAFLLCKYQLIDFYKKYNWKLADISKILFFGKKIKTNQYCMSYNFKKKIKKKIEIYMNS